MFQVILIMFSEILDDFDLRRLKSHLNCCSVLVVALMYPVHYSIIHANLHRVFGYVVQRRLTESHDNFMITVNDKEFDYIFGRIL